MFENCKIFNNKELIESWFNNVKPSEEESKILYDNIDYVENSNIVKYEGYNQELNKFLNHIGNISNFDLLLNTCATNHINDLFKNYVNNTLVIVSDYQHESVLKNTNNIKNLIVLENSSISEIVSESKKYDDVFIYVIGTDGILGKIYDNDYYKNLCNELKNNNIKYTIVLDAVQEMFLLPRDYSFYHYIVGTMHNIYPYLDSGFLLINKEFIKEEYYNFTGYKDTEILKRINSTLDIILSKKDKILQFSDVIKNSINERLFSGFNTKPSLGNFFTIAKKDNFMYNEECRKFIENIMIKNNEKYDFIINTHLFKDELNFNIKAQLFIHENNTCFVLNDFYNTYRELQRLILKNSMK